MLITIKQDSMKKSMAKQGNMNLRQAKKAVRKGEMTPDDAGAKGLGYEKDYNKLLKSRAYKKQRADESGYKNVRKAKKAAKANDGFLPHSSMAKQMAPIDPRTGMPIQPQMTPQPNTVGMPGSTPMPAGMGHTLPEHGMQAGGRHMSPYMQKKKTSIAGQDISESGHMNVNYKDGPKEGDLIRGPHLKYDNVGLPEDFDYKIKFEKDTVDQHGPYKIYKTTGIK